MQSGSILSGIVLCFILIAGCVQLPGIHFFSDTSDPVVSHWIGGELPLTDRHIFFYENRTFYSVNFYLNSGETIDSGTWAKKEPGLYTTKSGTGESTDWVYDSFDDSLYLSGLPQMRYHRYRG